MFRAGQKRILVVDDDEGVRSLLETSLTDIGFHVDTAADGESALRLWNQHTYGLIITDLIYLRHGGTNFIKAVRRQDDRIPILAITGYGQETAQEALDAGADHVLFKPFHLFQVRETVEKLWR